MREIPPAVQLEPLHLAAALLTAINLPHHAPLNVGWRAWSPPARPDLPAPVAAAAPAPAQLRVIVFTLASLEARDDILHRTPGLKNLTCQVIFGAGGDAKLSVNSLWPDPVHRLLKQATAKYKRLGHLRPLVKNLTVFLRPTKNGPLPPVTCEAEIDALTPQLPRRTKNRASRSASSDVFTAGHINVNGLFPSHFALLEAKVAESRFDATAIIETKITPLADVSHLALDGFNFFSR